jgi:hypothetical protein
MRVANPEGEPPEVRQASSAILENRSSSPEEMATPPSRTMSRKTEETWATDPPDAPQMPWRAESPAS